MNIPEGTIKKQVKNHIKVKVDILWKGNALSCVKTFGTRHCKLCSKERIAILHLTRKSPHLAINKCNEVHGACRHKPRFHRFAQSQTEAKNPSTDESIKDERVIRPSPSPNIIQGDAHSTNSADSIVDVRESESFPRPPNGTSPFGYHVNKKNGLIARSEILKQNEPNDQVEANLEKLPQELNDDWVDLSLSDALNDISI